MSDAIKNPFWDFSVSSYRVEGVAEACLRLQDRHGVDVNLFFYLCWLGGVRDSALEPAEVTAVQEATVRWRDKVVRPLREVRRHMKSGYPGMDADAVESLRTEVKRIELQCERQQQDFLYTMTLKPKETADLSVVAAARADRNVRQYLRLIGATLEPADETDCEAVLAGCFGPGPAAAE
jgi:uncharacterized protein (TIGR02444 family)